MDRASHRNVQRIDDAINVMKNYNCSAFYCSYCDKVFYVINTDAEEVVRCPYGCPLYNISLVLAMD